MRNFSRRELISTSSSAWFAFTLGGCAVSRNSASMPTNFDATPAPFPQFSSIVAEPFRQFDFSGFSDFLNIIVMDFGPADRVSLRQPSDTGTRIVPGHKSRYRLEGNRIPFEVFDDAVISKASEWRRAIEKMGNDNDLSQFYWHDQMAFWMNLHNAVVIEQIGKHYPKKRPHRIVVDKSGTRLFNAKLVSIKGQRLSLNDIRFNIVFRHWRHPLAIYGFFDGSIGGPSIQPRAFTGANVGGLLADVAVEFVNSLRGVEDWGNYTSVSRIYWEARALFPAWPESLREHLLVYADTVVQEILNKGAPIRPTIKVSEIADFSGGQPYARRGAKPPPPPGGMIAPELGEAIEGRFLSVSRWLPEHGRRLLREKQQQNLRLELRLRHERRKGSVTIEDLPSRPSK